jgi:hypothetical protein
MTRHPSTVLRVIRMLTALITVWCTGCGGFEPLVDAAFGAKGVAMTCPSGDWSGVATSTVIAAAQVAPASVAVLSTSATERGYSCGCSSCHAVTLGWSVLPPAPPTQAPAALPATTLASVARALLLPPPERTVS